MDAAPIADGESMSVFRRAMPRLHIPENLAVRWIGGAILFIVLLNVLIAAVNSYTRGPSGPASSSHATSAEGVAAWAELLERAGYRVEQLHVPLSDTELNEGTTVVVLDPDAVTPAAESALETFVDGGGRLVAGEAGPAPWLAGVLDQSPTWSPGGPTEISPVNLGPLPEVDGVESVRTAGEGHWSSDAPGTPALGSGAETLMAVAEVGGGDVVALADPSPLQNRLLGEADNARLSLQIIGGSDRPVVFVESVHGFIESQGEGLAAIPARWRVAAAGLLAAVLALMLARVRRLGPPELAARPLPPARRAYVDSLGVALRRTKRPAEATASLRLAARNQLARRTGLAVDASEHDLVAAARRLGIPEDEVRGIVDAPKDDGEVLAAGRALARLMGGKL
jgi:hypothetical protein